MNKKVLHSVIDHISETFKERIAIEDPAGQISYGKLRDYSNRIAHNLLNAGMKKGDVVGVYLESSINYVAGIIGVNKAGGIFMPLELAYPPKRTVYILEKAQPSIIITEKRYAEDLLGIYESISGAALKKRVFLSGSDQPMELEETGNPNIVVGPWDETPVSVEVDGEDSNYLLYTSGSTGHPKIIEGCHKSLSHFIHWEKVEFSLDEHVRVSQLAPISFDVSLRDIFVPLLCGGTLCIPERGVKLEPLKLIAWIGRTQITLMHTVPSVFRLITQALKDDHALLGEVAHLKYILLAGEALYGRDVVAWRNVASEKTELVNVYGPTETTLAKLFNRIGEIDDPQTIVPLGKPISNTAVIIITYGQLCSIGAIGEIYIKTPFRSKGYYKDESQTRERFIQNPLHNDYEDILYKTGDLGRYQENGYIEFIGREDSQIKIRGNRVELSEVEKVIMTCEGVKQVVVMPVKKSEDEDILVCYYISELTEEISLRDYIKNYLPDYMHPSYYVKMDEFPLNLNGKIDKKSLPRPDELLYEKLSYEGPANEMEEKIAAIWSEVLGLKKVGVLNSFFELGGHSLTATRVVSRIFKETGRQISLKDFFDHSNVRSLAQMLNSKRKVGYQSIGQAPHQEHYELSHAQKRLWIHHNAYGSTPFHMLGGCYINNHVDVMSFEKAFNDLIERHESLRTTFVFVSGEVRQKISTRSPFRLTYIDLTSESNQDAIIAGHLEEEANNPFNLENGPLLRAKLIHLNEARYLFLFNIHHIVSDEWSMRVLIKEVLALYETHCSRQHNPLPPLRIQYKDYAVWQQKMLSDNESINEDRAYWLQKFSGGIPRLNLPTDFVRPELKTFKGSSYFLKFSRIESDEIRKVCKEQDVSLFMFSLAIINIILYKLSGQKEIHVGTPVAGRDHADLENQIGCFLNDLILKNEIDRNETFPNFLQRVKHSTLEAFEHQQYPFDKLLEDLNIDVATNPVFDVVVVMSNPESQRDNHAGQVEITGNSEPDVNTTKQTSKVDLSFFIGDSNEISILIEYSTELYKAETIEGLANNIYRLMKLLLTEDASQGINVGEIVGILIGSNKEQLLMETTEDISENF